MEVEGQTERLPTLKCFAHKKHCQQKHEVIFLKGEGFGWGSGTEPRFYVSDMNYTQKLKYELDLRNKPFGILASSESFLRIVLLFLVVVFKKISFWGNFDRFLAFTQNKVLIQHIS